MTPAQAWWHAPHERGRARIYAALKIDPTEPTAPYACALFRALDLDDATWIASPTAGFPCLAVDAVLRSAPEDIPDVILWSPRTGTLRIAGESANTPALITPHPAPETLTVYGDGYAFFRAWADARAEFFARWRSARAGTSFIPTEPTDGGMPGALVIGDLDKIHWRHTGASVLVAGPGVPAAKLKTAVFRSARLPRVQASVELARAA
jgi:hypothetical protein